LTRPDTMKRSSFLGIGVVLILALVAGVVLATGDGAEMSREAASNETSWPFPSDSSDSSGPFSRPAVGRPEPAGLEPVIPRTEPVKGVDSTCQTGRQDPGPSQRQVLVYFHCDVAPDQERGRTVVPVPRLVTDSPGVLESSLSELLIGPSEIERADGFYSPFSDGTSSLLAT
jgi:hypothetical protein